MTADTVSSKILTGMRLHLARIAWTLAIAVSVSAAIYILNAFTDYLGTGIADVSGVWNSDNTAIVLTPLTPETAAVIRPGDLLLGQDNKPLPHRLTYTVGQTFPVYGKLDSVAIVTVQTPGQAPRTVTLRLDTIEDPTLRWIVSTGADRNSTSDIWVALQIVWILGFWAFALLIALKRSDERMALLSSAVIFALGPRYGIAEILRFLPPYEYPLQTFASLTEASIQLAFLLLPNGRWYPARFSKLFWAAYLLFALNRYLNVIPALNTVYFYVDICFYVGVFAIQVYRYRSFYTAVERQQMKWVLVGIICAAFGYFLVALLSLVVGINQGLAAIVLAVLGRIAIAAAPIGIAIGILRYRLYDADYVLDRGVVFGSVTVLLAALFFGLILLIQRLVPTVLSVIVAALIVGVLFQPVRRRVQHFIDRRFFRLRLDLNQWATRQKKTKPRAGPGPLSGKMLGELQFGELIGSGGMGQIYEARRGVQKLAVKVLPTDPLLAEHVRQFFSQEITIMKNLAHPNIVHLVATGTADDVPYLAMEYVIGHPLDQYLSEKAALPLDQTVLILKDVAAALDYVHKQGIVHRDVKPANVILQDMRAVLIDFGLATFVDNDKQDNSEDDVVGTLSYIAPEQINANEGIDQRADQYALSVMAYEMLTGTLPFSGSVGQLVFAHLNQPPPDPCRIQPNLPVESGTAIMRALSKDPEQRFNSVTEFVEALAFAK